MKGNMMRQVLAATIVAALALVGSSTALATPTTTTNCLAAPRIPGSSKFVSGLPMTRDQKLEVEAMIAQNLGHRLKFNVHQLDGLGLSAAVRNEIARRVDVVVAAQVKASVACPVFTDPQQVIGYVHDLLVYNGFRPSTRVWQTTDPRKLQIDGIQDGIEVTGTVMKTGDHQIALILGTTSPQLINVKFTP